MKKLLFPLFVFSILFSENKIPFGYHTEARLNIERPCDLFFSSSYIFWQPLEEGLDAAQGFPKSGYESSMVNKAQKVSYGFKSGFKIGMGINFIHDKWDCFAEYTRLTGHDSISKSAANDETLIATWLPVETVQQSHTLNSLSALSSLNLNNASLLFYKELYSSKRIILSPSFGIATAFISQKYNVQYDYNYLSDPALSSHNSSRTWSLGPKVGLKGDFNLLGNFKFLAKGAVILAYEYYKITLKLNSQNQSYSNTSETGWQLQPAFETSLGFSFGGYSCGKKLFSEFSLLYEFTSFLNQNFSRALKDSIKTQADGERSDLSFHGPTASLKFIF